ncbi:chondroitin sulfate synthase 3-like isoform X2 [Dysidea avara]|uniref:chondroitin sulfate synthase 3-like isoform X2 n=1 Tax=Dysidea avara TaxID=196820 RepID=UPI003333E636
MLFTAKSVVFLGVGFMLGFLLNGLFHYQDKEAVKQLCTEQDSVYQLYKKCIKRQREGCPQVTEPSFKNIKTPTEITSKKMVNSELEHEVRAPSDTAKRSKLLSQELSPRKLVLVGVVTAQKYLDTRATAVYNTWGKQMADIIFFSEQPNSTQHVQFSVVTLLGVDDHTYPPQHDDMYVKKQDLYNLLLATNPAQKIYMGSPGFGKPEDRKRLKLEDHEHYCMGGPGVIFSRALLRKLGPLVDDCLENVVVSYNEDVEVGRCISRKLNTQCTWAYQTRDLFFMDYSKEMVTDQLYQMDSIKTAITLHPLKEPSHMYRVHQYILELTISKLQEDVQMNTYEIQAVNDRILPHLQRYQAEAWTGHYTKFQPTNRFEVLTWYYFNSSRLFSDAEGRQAVTLPSDLKYSVNSVALKILVNHMNHFSSDGRQYTSPYHLYDGFVVPDLSRGLEYVLRLSLHIQGNSDPYRVVANVFIPLSSAPMVQVKPWASIVSSVSLVVLVHIDEHTNHTQFFLLFEKACLQRSLTVSLRVALTPYDGSNDVIDQITLLQSRYPSHNITYEVTTRPNRGHALHLIVPKEDQQRLLLFLDPNYLLTETFIDHCLMNAIPKKQVYFPVIFSLFNTAIANSLNIPRKSLVSPETGFWNKYNYQVVCIYHSDYISVGGFNTTMQSGEDVAFFEKIRQSPLGIFRALEPYLVRPFTQRSCHGLSETEQVTCLNAVMDTVGSRRQLGLLVLKHKLV